MARKLTHRSIVDCASQYWRDRRADVASDCIAESGDWRADLDFQILQGGYCIDRPEFGAAITTSDIPRAWYE